LATGQFCEAITKRNVQLAACAALFAVLSSADGALAQAGKNGVERLYILDCGHGRAADQSLWSPGANVGKAFDVSDNCYLIKHAQGWFL
jgi:N-acyl homoserine lactone hydrolase